MLPLVPTLPLVTRPGLPRAYFDEVAHQIDRLPEGVMGSVYEPSTLRLSRAGRAHRRAARMCFRALTELHPAEGESSWWIEVEPDVLLPDDLLGVPDLAGWRIDRIAPVPQEGPLSVAPDFCCKVISADTAKSYRVARLPLYARAGVQWFWLIDPTARTLEVFELKPNELALALSCRDDDQPILPPVDRVLPLAPWWLP
jgi:Uma2 family endonuclease